MIRKRSLSLYFSVWFCFFSHFAYAHTYTISVLVDTDMALDDIRAISMLLNSDMVNIPLIVTSDGAVTPEVGCQNLEALLKYFKREDIKVAKGKLLGKPAPPWRSWSEDLKWPEPRGEPGKILAGREAAAEILKRLEAIDEEIPYVCLGPLTNLAEALKLRPQVVKARISRLIYFGGHPDEPFRGWNTNRDPESARLVFDSGLNIYSISLPEQKLLRFDQELYKQINDIDTAAARLVTNIHQSPTVSSLLSEGHFHVWDEMAVIFLNQPALFKFVPSTSHDHVMRLANFEAQEVHNVYLKLLSYSRDFHLGTRHSVVLNAFPTDPSLFRDDVRPYVKEAIERYGLEEWKACLLTNEFHRHLGTYSIIGAKMGVRAREILEAPFDTLKVVSLAGSSPPLSCMNDGLQVSTGASLGRGTIKIAEGTPKPEAVFLHGGQKVTLKIKKEVVDKIEGDIKAALKEYGGLNPSYFARFRKLSLDYWLDLDRREIFDELKGSLGSGQ